MINDVWKINTECRELLNKQLKNKTIKLNLNGHMSHMNDADVEYITSKIDEMLLCEGLQRKDAEYLIEALSSKKDFDWVSLPIRATGLTCSDCSELLELECNGKEIRCNNPCKHPGGMIYEIELNVPSGRMVVENDLRKWWKVIGNYNVNTPLGCCQTTKKYAEVGMAHAFVGNTCPDVYHIKSDRLAIGISDYRTQRNPIKNTRSVASICTDLWWYSIVDYNDFRSRGLDSPTATVKCRPGVYRFRHLYHTVDRNTPGGKIFTEIEWMRKPDKVVDFVAKYKKLDFSAEQIVADLMKFQTTLDNPENELELIQQKVDYLMCVSGAGADYHENGWWGFNPDLKMNAPKVKIPTLRAKYRWYPFYEESLIVMASSLSEKPNYLGIVPKDIRLNKSFTSLAFNVLHCISKYGVDDCGYGWADNTISLAKKTLIDMAKKYPDDVPVYVKNYLKDE
jgi:hypothetical protein